MATIGFPDSEPVVTITTNPQDAEHAVFLQCGKERSFLTVSDALDLLQWLYEQRSELYELAHRKSALPTKNQIQADIDYSNFYHSME